MSKTTRQNSRVAVIVHSHQSEEALDISLDVIEMSCSKTIKGAGSFNLTIVPRRNYFNYLFPNDVVNIYIDPGDGERGFVRTMMGYIDRVERSEQVNEETGAISTMFRVTGSDFTKAFDKTEIYFNPALQNRKELIDPRFGSSLLGQGSALRTRGIQAHGTPADMIENLLTLLMGFGKQWVMPTSYPKGFVEQRRLTRRQRAAARVQLDIITALQRLGFSETEPQQVLDDLLGSGATIEEALFNKFKQQTGAEISDVPTEEQVANGFRDKQQLVYTILQASSAIVAYQSIAKDASTGSSVVSLLDILELGFIEAMAIDGFIAATPVWTQQGPLASILYGFSNEIVNELCFDLRPVSTAEDGVFGQQYSKNPDEHGINVNGTDNFPPSATGVEYRPAVIMREYPYSVVEGLDLTRFNVLGAGVGFVQFGPIFRVDPNASKPGRKIFRLRDAITPEADSFPATSAPLKHLDVVPIYDTDVTGDTVGRSDHDTFNLFALFSNDALQRVWKFLLQDILPIVTPVSIARNGLRVHELNTRFANYSRDQLNNGSSGNDGSAVDDGQIRRNLIRWALLIDHWNQHNIEYLSGSISLRAMPEIRVGYRLDWVDRHESYYVEQVGHQFHYPNAVTTSVQVSRGQRNDPFPAYIPPIMAQTGGIPAGAPQVQPSNFVQPSAVAQAQQDARERSSSVAQQGGGNRSADGRLGLFFDVIDTHATKFSTQGKPTPQGSDANELDQSPNSDFGQRAEYAEDQFATRDLPSSDQLNDSVIPADQGTSRNV